MSVDPNATVEIAGSPWKMLALGLLGIGMTALSFVFAWPLVTFTRESVVSRAVGAFGVAFFGLCTLLIFRQALTSTGPVVTLSPTGLRDTRLASAEIPWSAVRRVSTWASQGQRFMVLDVAPDVEARLGLSTIARMTRGANRSLGADGLCVGAQGLAIDFEALLDQTVAYATTYGNAVRVE